MNGRSNKWLPLAVVSTALGFGGMVTQAQAQVAPMPYTEVDMLFDSGEVANNDVVKGAGGDMLPAVIWSQVVVMPNASWSRLFFGQVMLSGTERNSSDSFVRITSLIDGADQVLNARTMEQWGLSSARFVGGQVLVELLAYPGTGPNRIQINSGWAGDLEPAATPESQCGPTDDRVASTDDRVGRVSPIGCTAWLIDTASESCMVSAGHCPGHASWTTSEIIEFQVPLSNANTTTNPSDPDDQYPIDYASIQFEDAGYGNDWMYFGTFSNANTGLTPLAAQGAAFTLPTTQLAPNNQTLRITGFGTDTGTANQTQQTDTGTYDFLNGETVNYDDVDTEGGNSGGPVYLDDPSQRVIAIHTNGGCMNPALGNTNRGCRIDDVNFQAAVNDPQGVCDPFGSDCPGSGDCFTANGTPGCDDGTCCDTVCAVDPFCCTNQWDTQCANEAQSLCADCTGDAIIESLGTGLGPFAIIGENGVSSWTAAGVTVPQAYELECLTFRLNYIPGAANQVGNGDARVSIWTGAGGPATEIMALSAPLIQQGLDEFTFLPPSSLVMVPGETYWVLLQNDGPTGSYIAYSAPSGSVGVGTIVGGSLRRMTMTGRPCPADVILDSLGTGLGNFFIIGQGGSSIRTVAGVQVPVPYAMECLTFRFNYIPGSGNQVGNGNARVSVWTGAGSPTTEIMVLNATALQAGLGEFTFLPPSPLVMFPGETYWLRLQNQGATGSYIGYFGDPPTGIGTYIPGDSGLGARFTLTANQDSWPNDDCANAIPVLGGSSTPFNTAGATTEGGQESCGTLQSDLFYTYTATATGQLTVSACDAGIGRAIAVYDGCGCTLAPFSAIACADDGCSLGPLVQVPVTAGNCYLIRVGASIIGEGSGTLNVSLDAAPANDSCIGAIEVFEGLTPFDNTSATDSNAAASCGPIESDLYFYYTATGTGDLTVQTCTTTFASVWAAYDGCGCPVGTEIACPINGFCFDTFPVIEGNCYLIRVGSDPGFGGGVGTGDLDISLAVETPCGDPGAGSCLEPNGTPGCDDSDCCTLVCDSDAYCCDNLWDQICADAAIAMCGLNNCPCDVVVDGMVNVQDLLFVLAQWGTPNGDCNMDGTTNVLDVLALLGAWGPCPI